MREIKFRGKRVCDGLWLYGNLIQSNVGNITINGTNKYCRVDPKTVGQYTGLHDKNGKEIYEGDILQFKCIYNKKKVVYKFVVLYDEDSAEFVLENIDDTFFVIDTLSKDEGEIIGNIHENKLEELK